MVRLQVKLAFRHTSLTTFLQIQKKFILTDNKKFDLVKLSAPIADRFQYTAKFYTEIGHYNTQITVREK